MDWKTFICLGVLVIATTCYADETPVRQSVVTELSTQEQALLAKVSSSSELTNEDILALMEMKKEKKLQPGDLTSFAALLLKLPNSTAIISRIKDKLNQSQPQTPTRSRPGTQTPPPTETPTDIPTLSDIERAYAFALSMTTGGLTTDQMKAYTAIMLSAMRARAKEVEEEEEEENDASIVNPLVTKLMSGAVLTTDGITRLIESRLKPVQHGKLAERIMANVNNDTKAAIIQKIREKVDLSDEEENIRWALELQNGIPEGTEKTFKEERKAAVAELAKNESLALTVLQNLNNVDGDLTGEDFDTATHLFLANRLNSTQRAKFLTTVAENLAAEEDIASIIDDLKRNNFNVEKQIEFAALALMNMLPEGMMEKLRESMGMIGNGYVYGDVFEGAAEVPDSEELSADDIAKAREIGTRLTGFDYFKVMSPRKFKAVIMAYTSMSDALKTKLQDVAAAVSTLTEDDIQAMAPFLSLLDSETLLNIADRAGADVLKSLCREVSLADEDEVWNQLQEKCIPILEELASTYGDAEKEKLAEKIIAADGQRTELTADVKENLRKLGSTEAARERMTAGDRLDSDVDLEEEIKEDGGRRLLEAFKKENANTLASATADHLKKLAPALKSSDIAEADADQLKEGASEIMEKLTGLREKESLKKRVATAVQASGDPSSYTATDIRAIMAVGKVDELGDVPGANLIEAVSDLDETSHLKKRDMKTIFDAVMSESDFSNASSITSANIKKMASLIGEAPDRFVESLQDTEFANAIDSGSFRDIRADGWSGNKKQKFINNVRGDLNATEAGNIPGDILRMRECVDKLSNAALQDSTVRSKLTEDGDAPKPALRAIVNKLKTNGTLNICEVGKICDAIDTTELENLPNSFLTDIENAGISCSLECGKSRLAILAAKMKRILGELDSGNYGGGKWVILAQMVEVLAIADLEKIPTDILPSVAEKADKTLKSREKRKVIIDRLAATMDGETLASKSAITALGPRLKTMNATQIAATVDPSYCSDAVGVLSDVDFTNVDIPTAKEQAAYAIECGMSGASGDIDVDAVSGMGYLSCFLSESHMSRLTDAAVDEISTIMPYCPIVAFLSAYYEKFATLEGLGDVTMSSLTETQFAAMIGMYDFTDADLAAVDTTLLSDMMEDYVKMLEEKLEVLEERGEVSADKTYLDSEKAKGDKLIKKMIGARMNEGSSAARRRRSTGTLTCTTVQGLGQQAKALTVDQLGTLTDTEMTDCMYYLGLVLEWSSEQKQLLGGRLKDEHVLNTDVTQWSANNIQNAGILVEGLSSTDLGNLAWTRDLLGMHGGRSTWTNEQLAAVTNKWMTSENDNDAAALTTEDFATIGNFICGLTTAHIQAIPAAVFENSVVDIGLAQGCSEAQAQEFAAKAKTLYGDPNVWTANMVMTANTILAGLSSSEFSSLSTGALSEVDPQTIPLLSPNTISGLTDVQIRGLSYVQASQVTEDQYDAFNPSQKQALAHARGETYTESAAAVKMASVFMTVLVTMTTFMML